MHTITLFGAGKIGEAIAALLSRSGRYTVRVCDVDGARTQQIATRWPRVEAFVLNLKDREATRKLLAGSRAVISALPFHCNVAVAELAAESGVHYFDLTEDVATTKAVSKLAEKAGTVFMPQCGLAPGFISVAAAHLMQPYEKLDSVRMRVGALPTFPSNRLRYNLTWSTEGLINEYCNLCEAVDNGQKILLQPLEGYERFSLDGVDYEAFNTSGGLGTLCDSLTKPVRQLNYKTIRYPGHCEYIRFLLHDLGFIHDRATLKSVFERSIPTTHQDKCIVYVEVIGSLLGRLTQRTYASTVYNTVIDGVDFGAIQVTTAAGVLAPLDLVLEGRLQNKRGLVRCEEISLPEFLANEFGKHYATESAR